MPFGFRYLRTEEIGDWEAAGSKLDWSCACSTICHWKANHSDSVFAMLEVRWWRYGGVATCRSNSQVWLHGEDRSGSGLLAVGGSGGGGGGGGDFRIPQAAGRGGQPDDP
jgi:hypothetical protein